MVGSLVYLVVTCLDIAYSIHTVSQFMSTARFTYYAVVLHILRYVKGTIFNGLHFLAHSFLLYAYLNVDWVGDTTDKHLLLDFVFFR